MRFVENYGLKRVFKWFFIRPTKNPSVINKKWDFKGFLKSGILTEISSEILILRKNSKLYRFFNRKTRKVEKDFKAQLF